MIYYKTYGFDPYERYYYVLRIDFTFPFIHFYKQENTTWDLNRLLRILELQLKLESGLQKFYKKVGLEEK